MGLDAAAYQRMMKALLPPGQRLWRFVVGLVEPLLLGTADELERLHARADVLAAESVPNKADELLPEYEADYDLAPTGTNAERQARVVSRELAEQGFRPTDLQSTLAPILGLDPSDVQVLERTHAMAVAMGDEREIFTYFVYRDPALPGTYDVDAAQQLLYDIEHSHTDGHVIESISFCCDDPYSLCDRDLLGA